MRTVRLLAVFSLLGGLVVPALAQDSADDPSGDYALAGESASGAAYRGAISIVRRGRGFDVTWDRPAPLHRRGIALRLGNVLGVVAEDNEAGFGIVLYRVKEGHLEGVWKTGEGRKVTPRGREILDGPAGLEGSYAITLGENPDHSHYTGTVTIRKSGSLYLVDWSTPDPGGIGTGVLVGDIFVVGYSQLRRSGVAAYCLRSETTLQGITGEADDGALGAEILWRGTAPAAEEIASRLPQLRTGGPSHVCGAPIAARDPAPAAGKTAIAAE